MRGCRSNQPRYPVSGDLNNFCALEKQPPCLLCALPLQNHSRDGARVSRIILKLTMRDEAGGRIQSYLSAVMSTGEDESPAASALPTVLTIACRSSAVPYTSSASWRRPNQRRNLPRRWAKWLINKEMAKRRDRRRHDVALSKLRPPHTQRLCATIPRYKQQESGARCHACPRQRPASSPL